jgi:16S rRNA (guanine527-N7)-methyltransferase
MDLIRKYFPDLSSLQYEQLEALGPLYTDWNSKINVISRKDIDNLYEHHILHSMAIAKVIRFAPGTRLADVGTGGGLPGIPLAILFPECSFTLIDSIGKKVRVAQDIAAQIGLKNVIVYIRRFIGMTRTSVVLLSSMLFLSLIMVFCNFSPS